MKGEKYGFIPDEGHKLESGIEKKGEVYRSMQRRLLVLQSRETGGEKLTPEEKAEMKMLLSGKVESEERG